MMMIIIKMINNDDDDDDNGNWKHTIQFNSIQFDHSFNMINLDMILRTNNNRGPMYYCPYIYCLMMYKFLFYFFRLLFSTIDRKYEFLCCSKTLFIPKHLGFPSKLLISVYLIWLAYFLFLFLLLLLSLLLQNGSLSILDDSMEYMLFK